MMIMLGADPDSREHTAAQIETALYVLSQLAGSAKHEGVRAAAKAQYDVLFDLWSQLRGNQDTPAWAWAPLCEGVSAAIALYDLSPTESAKGARDELLKLIGQRLMVKDPKPGGGFPWRAMLFLGLAAGGGYYLYRRRSK